jgi:hypothetical protein
MRRDIENGGNLRGVLAERHPAQAFYFPRQNTLSLWRVGSAGDRYR